MKKYVFILSFIGMFVVACSDDGGSPSTESEFSSDSSTGSEIFSKRLQGANQFTCATCHSVDSISTGGFRTVGHDLSDAFRRTTYKNGQLNSLRDGVNNCVEHWMVGDVLAEDAPIWLTLLGWFEDMAPATTTNLTYNIVSPPGDVTGGDVTQGMETFDATCARCHGAGAVGTLRGPSLAGTTLSGGDIANRVRTSGPTTTGVYPGLTGGRMPFWAEDRLSDTELKDIIAFLEQTVPIEDIGAGTSDISLPGAQTTGACGSDHATVGSVANLSTVAHLVSGRVEVIDNCTLEITNFNFDGGGINIQVYGGTGGSYAPPTGFSMSENMLGQAYTNQTVRIRLPSGTTLDDLDGISVWCVPVGADFGSGSW